MDKEVTKELLNQFLEEWRAYRASTDKLVEAIENLIEVRIKEALHAAGVVVEVVPD